MGKDIYLFLDSIRSLYNVGAILRTAEAVGVKKVFLGVYSGIERIGNKVQLHPKLAKTALDGLTVDWEFVENPLEKLKHLKKQGFQIVSLEQTPSSLHYKKALYKFPLCLVVGHEREGVNPQINSISDLIVSIPMFGKGKSLNVSVATGIALYEIKSRSRNFKKLK